MGKLDEFAADLRRGSTNHCTFCALGEAAQKDLVRILAQNDAGKWDLPITSAMEWFRAEYGYKYTQSALLRHVHVCMRRKWTS